MDDKYLIIECNEDKDYWAIVTMTNDYSSYGIGYDVYKVLPNGEFVLIKGCDVANERGIAIYYWRDDMSPEHNDPIIVAKYANLTKNDTDKLREILLATDEFKEDVEDALKELLRGCAYGVTLDDGTWFVIGSYEDDRYDYGY